MMTFEEISPLIAETDPAFNHFLELTKMVSDFPSILSDTDFEPEETETGLSLKYPDPLSFDRNISSYDYDSSSLSVFNSLSNQIAHFNQFNSFSSSAPSAAPHPEPFSFSPVNSDSPLNLPPSPSLTRFNYLTSQISEFNNYSAFHSSSAPSDRSAYNITDDSPRFLQTHQNRYDSTVSAQNLYNTAQQNYISSNERLEENLKSLLAVAKQIKDVLLKHSAVPHGPIPIDIHGD